MFAALAIALVAVAVAIGAWFRPIPAATPTPAATTFTDQQIADAKSRVCEEFNMVHKAVVINTGRDGGGDPTATLAVAANARLSLAAGGQSLLSVLGREAATPAVLADAVRTLANDFQELAIGYMADAKNTDPAQEALLREGDTATLTIEQLCK